jgi:hypothetical protein
MAQEHTPAAVPDQGPDKALKPLRACACRALAGGVRIEAAAI